jgi:branched-chain amino acid transport system ATP-binding protein
MTETPLLQLEDVHSYYETSHVLQGVSLTLEQGALSIVGRNGMGKSTMVKTIMGIVRARQGKILFHGDDITHLKPYQIGALGLGYVPQGRELFPSLSVHEHLLLTGRGSNGDGWNIDRVYELFPRLQERSKLSAAQLSGGEQQMLAIARALVSNPKLLIMDEPSEGLAPVILDHLMETYHSLLESGMSILMVEQNLHTAVSISEDLYIMVAGRIINKIQGKILLHDQQAREKYLGVKVKETT